MLSFKNMVPLLFSLFLTTSSVVYAQETTLADDHTDEDGHGHGHMNDSCSAETEDFNIGLRVGSIFIIMATTLLGVFAPMILHRIKPYSAGSFQYWILTIGKFFGTGVILAVAFVHMIPESMERFESPCIGDWPEFEGFTGVFALAAVFFVQFLELAILTHVEQFRKTDSTASSATDAIDKDLEIAPVHNHNHHHHIDHALLDHEMKNIGTIILEIGIIIHSVIIGLTLGFASSDELNVLMIALVFHQFFEGIALGTRINEMGLKSMVKPLLMGLAFAVTTPIGVAIGIAVNLTVNPYSPSSVAAQAILEALAAGILLYNAFISLVSAEITHNPSFRSSSLGHKFTCLISMYIGAAVMAVLGLWA